MRLDGPRALAAPSPVLEPLLPAAELRSDGGEQGGDGGAAHVERDDERHERLVGRLPAEPWDPEQPAGHHVETRARLARAAATVGDAVVAARECAALEQQAYGWLGACERF